MILFLYGKDTFRSKQQLKKMIEKFKVDRDPGGYNVARIDALTEKNAGKIMSEILTTPFLAERRFVAIESLLASKQVELQKELFDRIENKRLPDSNVIVFWEATDTFKTKDAKALFERLSKEKYAQAFDELVGAKLAGHIAAEVKERGGSIASNAVQYLVAHVGTDMWYVSTLIDQLIAYSLPYEGRVREGSGEIAIKDVQLFLDEKVDDNIFNLVDSILAKQSKKVFSMIQEQYRKGEDVQYIFAMILRQCRILLELRDLHDREQLSSDQLAKKLSLHPFVVKKSMPMIKQYSFGTLQHLYHSLLEFDIHTKTGFAEPETLLDVWVGRLCLAQ